MKLTKLTLIALLALLGCGAVWGQGVDLPYVMVSSDINNTNWYYARSSSMVKQSGARIQLTDGTWGTTQWVDLGLEGVPGRVSVRFVLGTWSAAKKTTRIYSSSNRDMSGATQLSQVSNSSTDGRTQTANLGKDQRYIRLWAENPSWSSTWVNIESISVTKSIDIAETSLEPINTNVGEVVTKTFNVNYSNTSGSISVTSNHPNVTVSLDKSDVAGQDGVAVVTYSYNPESVVASESATIKVQDDAYADNYDEVSLSLKAGPQAPQLVASSDITPISFKASWGAVSIAEGYKLALYDASGANLLREINAVGAQTELSIDGLTAATAYKYRVYTISAGVESQGDIAFNEVVTAPIPVLTLGSLNPYIITNGQSANQSLSISGENLQGAMEISIAGSEYFTLSASSLAASGEIEVTYSVPSATIASHQATITLSSAYADDQTIDISGVSIPNIPTATEATEIKGSSFYANWTAVDGATDYLLTVVDSLGVVLDGYNAISVGVVSSHQVIQLLPESSYKYRVQAKYLDYVTALSNEISATTEKKPTVYYTPLEPFVRIVGESSIERTSKISGISLLGEIHVAIAGDEVFTISTTTIPVEGGDLEVAFSPVTVGKYSATITLSTQYGDPIDIALTGVCKPGAVVATDASAITAHTAQANWDSIAEVPQYLLTLTQAGAIVEGYDKVEVNKGHSLLLTGLLASTEYSYTVVAVAAGVSAQPSNAISFTTLPAPVIEVAERVSIQAAYNATNTISVAIAGQNIQQDYTVAIAGDESLVIDKSTISKEGGEIVLTFTPNTIAAYTATLTISSLEAATKTIIVEAVGTPTVPIAKTVGVNKRGFVAQWGTDILTEDYLLTVRQNGEMVDGYNKKSLGNVSQVTVDGLIAATEYTYTVEAQSGAIVSSATTMHVTTASDYGQQLANSGFEAWEFLGQEKVEPTNWNSFMTASASGIYAGAKSKKVDVSTDTRAGSWGQSSAHIWSNKVVGQEANGNLTTGRIYAGSISPTDVANHNKTFRSNALFNQTMTVVPDSVSVWVKFKPQNSGDIARIALQIHGDTDFRDPNNDATNASFLVASAEHNYPNTNDQWVRLSVPFVKGTHEDPRYLLATFTTNKTPGQGTDNDHVWVDDLLMIYKPTVEVGDIASTSYAIGQTIEVPFILTGTMSPSNLDADANVVTLELSDKTGSFATPTLLASLTTDVSGVLRGVIPQDIATGDGYRVRVVTTNYPMVSADNGVDIAIGELSVPTVETNELDEFRAEVGSQAATQTLQLTAQYLQGAISLEITGADKEYFSLSQATIEPAADGAITHANIEVAYMPLMEGDHTAAISITTEALDAPIVIALSATASITIGVEKTNAESIKVYPNPATEFLYIDGVKAVRDAKIYNLEGAMVAISPIEQGRINVRAMGSGVYLLVIPTEEGNVKRTFIKK